MNVGKIDYPELYKQTTNDRMVLTCIWDYYYDPEYRLGNMFPVERAAECAKLLGSINLITKQVEEHIAKYKVCNGRFLQELKYQLRNMR